MCFLQKSVLIQLSKAVLNKLCFTIEEEFVYCPGQRFMVTVNFVCIVNSFTAQTTEFLNTLDKERAFFYILAREKIVT